MSARQFYIMLVIGVFSMKMQKLPSLVYGELGKDGYLLFLFYMLINLLFIIWVFYILKKVKIAQILSPTKSVTLCGFRKIIMVVAAVYFLTQALLLYEHIQGLFANTLFDNLSWALFSLLLLFAVFFLAYRGIENIALNYEIYFWVILGSAVIISILGAGYTDFSVVLPFENIEVGKILKTLPDFSFWFGDAILVLILGLKSKEIKLSKTILLYVLTMCFVSFVVIEFFGMYGDYSAAQSGLISVLSSQALLGLNVGRIDWFLILFAEIGAVLTCSVYLYYSCLCAESTFPKIKPFLIKILIILLLYIFDVFYFVDMAAKVNFFAGNMSWFSVAVQVVLPIILLIVAGFINRQSKGINTPEHRRLK